MSSNPVSQTSIMEFSSSSNEQTSSQLALELIIGRLRTNPALIHALASSIRSGELALILQEEVEDFEEPKKKRMRKVIDASGTLQDLQKNQPWVLDEVLKHLLPSEYSTSWSVVLNDQDKMNVVSLVLFLDKNVCLYPARGGSCLDMEAFIAASSRRYDTLGRPFDNVPMISLKKGLWIQKGKCVTCSLDKGLEKDVADLSKFDDVVIVDIFDFYTTVKVRIGMNNSNDIEAKYPADIVQAHPTHPVTHFIRSPMQPP